MKRQSGPELPAAEEESEKPEQSGKKSPKTPKGSPKRRLEYPIPPERKKEKSAKSLEGSPSRFHEGQIEEKSSRQSPRLHVVYPVKKEFQESTKGSPRRHFDFPMEEKPTESPKESPRRHLEFPVDKEPAPSPDKSPKRHLGFPMEDKPTESPKGSPRRHLEFPVEEKSILSQRRHLGFPIDDKPKESPKGSPRRQFGFPMQEGPFQSPQGSPQDSLVLPMEEKLTGLPTGSPRRHLEFPMEGKLTESPRRSPGRRPGFPIEEISIASPKESPKSKLDFPREEKPIESLKGSPKRHLGFPMEEKPVGSPTGSPKRHLGFPMDDKPKESPKGSPRRQFGFPMQEGPFQSPQGSPQDSLVFPMEEKLTGLPPGSPKRHLDFPMEGKHTESPRRSPGRHPGFPIEAPQDEPTFIPPARFKSPKSVMPESSTDSLKEQPASIPVAADAGGVGEGDVGARGSKEDLGAILTEPLTQEDLYEKSPTAPPSLPPPAHRPLDPSRHPAVIEHPRPARVPPPPPPPPKEGGRGMVPGWDERYADKPIRWKTVPKKRPKQRTLWQQMVDATRKHVFPHFRRAMYVMMCAYWLWLLLEFRAVGRVEIKGEDKKHAVINKKFRIQSDDNDDYVDRYTYYVWRPSGGENLPPVDMPAGELTMKLKLYGPFISEKEQLKTWSEEKMKSETGRARVFKVVLERWYITDASYESTYRNPCKRKHKYIQQGILKKHDDPDAISVKKLVMVDRAFIHERSTQDYNKYPREFEVTRKADFEKPRPPGTKVAYAIGFGVYKEHDFSVPFSFLFTVDLITIFDRVLFGLIPMFCVAIFCVLQVNQGVAALFGLATLHMAFDRIFKLVEQKQLDVSAGWYDYDYLFFALALMVYFLLLAETRLHCFLLYYWLKITGMRMWPTLILFNVVAAVGSIYMNNVFICLLTLLFAIRCMEFLNKDPVPLIFNIIIVCNIYGKCWVGTQAAKMMLVHKETKNIGPPLTTDELKRHMFNPAVSTGLAVQFVWLLVYLIAQPQEFKRIHQIEEDEHNMRVIDQVQMTPLMCSTYFRHLRSKLRAAKSFFAYEIREMRARLRQYGPEPPQSTFDRLMGIAPQCRIVNWPLVFKMLCAGVIFVLLQIPYIYNDLDMNYLCYKNIICQKVEKEDIELGGGELRLGFLGVYCLLMFLLMVHSREVADVIAPVNHELLVFYAVSTSVAYVFLDSYKKMHEDLFKLSNKMPQTDRFSKVQAVLWRVVLWSSLAGVWSDDFVVRVMLNTAFAYAVGGGLDSPDILLVAFNLSAGFWGMATPVGSAVNMVGVGYAIAVGYCNRLTPLRFMHYALPFAALANLWLYLFLLLVRANDLVEVVRKAIGIKDEFE